MTTCQHLGALAVLVSLATGGCSSSSTDAPQTEDSVPRARRLVELTGGPAVARRVVLAPIPAAAIRACRAAQATTRDTLLCPRRLPRPVPSLERNPRFSKLLAEPLFPTRDAASGVSFSYGERPLHQSWRLRPCCFLHFTIERYRPLLLPPFRGRAVPVGGRRGSLARPIPGLFGLYQDHYLFRFRTGGQTYLATLHGLDADSNSLRVLGALVESVVPARSL